MFPPDYLPISGCLPPVPGLFPTGSDSRPALTPAPPPALLRSSYYSAKTPEFQTGFLKIFYLPVRFLYSLGEQPIFSPDTGQNGRLLLTVTALLAAVIVISFLTVPRIIQEDAAAWSFKVHAVFLDLSSARSDSHLTGRTPPPGSWHQKRRLPKRTAAQAPPFLK